MVLSLGKSKANLSGSHAPWLVSWDCGGPFHSCPSKEEWVGGEVLWDSEVLWTSSQQIKQAGSPENAATTGPPQYSLFISCPAFGLKQQPIISNLRCSKSWWLCYFSNQLTKPSSGNIMSFFPAKDLTLPHSDLEMQRGSHSSTWASPESWTSGFSDLTASWLKGKGKWVEEVRKPRNSRFSEIQI